jgi:lipopolysaccharide transport protein LptA
MTMRCPNSRFSALALLLLLWQPGSLALESDRAQAIGFSAEGGSTTSVKGELRILEMKTNVKVTQGTLQIMGDAAIIESVAASGEVTRVTVHGSPVRYQQQLDEQGGLVVGTSETLLFYTDSTADETILELIGKANIQSPDSAMTCAAIVYLADQDIIREATGPCEGILNKRSN